MKILPKTHSCLYSLFFLYSVASLGFGFGRPLVKMAKKLDPKTSVQALPSSFKGGAGFKKDMVWQNAFVDLIKEEGEDLSLEKGFLKIMERISDSSDELQFNPEQRQDALEILVTQFLNSPMESTFKQGVELINNKSLFSGNAEDAHFLIENYSFKREDSETFDFFLVVMNNTRFSEGDRFVHLEGKFEEDSIVMGILKNLQLNRVQNPDLQFNESHIIQIANALTYQKEVGSLPLPKPEGLKEVIQSADESFVNGPLLKLSPGSQPLISDFDQVISGIFNKAILVKEEKFKELIPMIFSNYLEGNEMTSTAYRQGIIHIMNLAQIPEHQKLENFASVIAVGVSLNKPDHPLRKAATYIIQNLSPQEFLVEDSMDPVLKELLWAPEAIIDQYVQLKKAMGNQQKN